MSDSSGPSRAGRSPVKPSPPSIYNTPLNASSPALAAPSPSKSYRRSPSFGARLDYFETPSQRNGQSSRSSPVPDSEREKDGQATPRRGSPLKNAGSRIPTLRSTPSPTLRQANLRQTPSPRAERPRLEGVTGSPGSSRNRPSTTSSASTQRLRRHSGQRLGATPQGPRRPSTSASSTTTSPRTHRYSMESSSSIGSMKSDRARVGEYRPPQSAWTHRDLASSPEDRFGYPRRASDTATSSSSGSRPRVRHPVGSFGRSGIPLRPAPDPPNGAPVTRVRTEPSNVFIDNRLSPPNPSSERLPSRSKTPGSSSLSSFNSAFPSHSRRDPAWSYGERENLIFLESPPENFTALSSRRTSYDPEGSLSIHAVDMQPEVEESGRSRRKSAQEESGEVIEPVHEAPVTVSNKEDSIQRVKVEIPPRRSSIEQSPSSSPRSPPQVSPRKSSIPDVYNSLVQESDAPTLPTQNEVAPIGRPTVSSAEVSPNPQTRKGPAAGLLIDLHAPPRSLSGSSVTSPPVPAKSPLRSRSSNTVTPVAKVELKPEATPSTLENPLASAATSTSSLTKSVTTDNSSEERRPRRRRGSKFFEMDEVHEMKTNVFPASESEIRFTRVTFPSVYSQDSGPDTAWSQPSASGWPQSDLSPVRSAHGGETPERERRRSSRMEDVWARKRGSTQSQQGVEALSAIKGLPPLPRLRMPDESAPGMTESPQSTVLSGTVSEVSNKAHLGHSPGNLTPNGIEALPKPVRSPSAPILGGPIKPTQKIPSPGLSPDPQLMPSAISRSPTAPSLSPGTTTPGGGSKRYHLIREIAMTERAYAIDLALVRDAFVPRDQSVSTPLLGDPPSDVRGATTPRTPSGDNSLNVPGYFTPYLNASSSSIQSSPNAWSKRSSVISGSSSTSGMGKPLSSADSRVIFSNIDHLAAGAEEMATAFEMAVGTEEASQTFPGREGEVGSDKIGEAFTSVLPRLRPLYLFYCARQSSASAKLIELQADPGYATYLKDCWSQIKSHTHAWNLDSMLIKPVQRITKYPLLFDDLLACTTPVHPDYFNIRAAAEMARSLAVEIDEEKRRKDVVAFALAPKKALSNPSPNKEVKGKGLKLFRREKGPALSLPISAASSSSDLDDTLNITETSLGLMKNLALRLEEHELAVRRIGKEIVYWTAAAKELLFAQDQLVSTWMTVVRLDNPNISVDRLEGFRGALKEALTSPWADLNEDIKDQVMPILAKLLQAAVNPRKVITRRDLKFVEYSRYISLREAKKPIEKALSQSARDFVALHTQLVRELPTLLEGYARILDIAIVAFSHCQGRYHQRVKEILEDFKRRWIALPRRGPSTSVELSSPHNNGENGDTGREIVKIWHQSWAPYAQVLDRFHFSEITRSYPSRAPSYNAPTERSVSGASVPPPSRSHSSSFREEDSRPTSPPRSASTRPRATSLRQKVQAVTSTNNSPVKTSPSESRFSILRGSTRPSKGDLAVRANRPSSFTLTGDSRSRYSFGLPKITSEGKTFEGLGFSPQKPSNAHNKTIGMRATSDPHAYAEIAESRDSNAGLGFGMLSAHETNAQTDTQEGVVDSAAATITASTGRRKVDAAEGWRNEPVLYQCACVADFDIRVWGNKKYRGLRFLSMRSGDLFDIFHEVGRIDELPSFPYPSIGVENDGILVGRGEDGSIGLLICSFLEPLRDD